jgi:hypothetical protein
MEWRIESLEEAAGLRDESIFGTALGHLDVENCWPRPLLLLLAGYV